MKRTPETLRTRATATPREDKQRRPQAKKQGARPVDPEDNEASLRKRHEDAVRVWMDTHCLVVDALTQLGIDPVELVACIRAFPE